jgi:hypothetical protein
MKLVELLTNLAEIEGMLVESKGELTPEDETKLKLFSESLLEKVDNYKHFFDRLEMSLDYWKKKENEAKKIKQALESNIERAEDYLKSVMLHKGITKLEGDEYTFTLSPTRGKIEITDEQSAREVYPREKITIEVDKEKLREDLEKGIDIQCAKIIQTYSLRAKAKTKGVK